MNNPCLYLDISASRTETTWQSLFFQDLDATTHVENIDNSVVTYWRSFIALCVNQPGKVNQDGQPSWRAILVAEQAVEDVKRWLSHL